MEYKGQSQQLKKCLKIQNKMYDWLIKSIVDKIRQVELKYKRLKNQIEDDKYSKKNYFRLEDVKSLGFLLNNPKFNHNRFKGERLYYKINEIIRENKKYNTLVKKLKNKSLLLEEKENQIKNSNKTRFKFEIDCFSMNRLYNKIDQVSSQGS